MQYFIGAFRLWLLFSLYSFSIRRNRFVFRFTHRYLTHTFRFKRETIIHFYFNVYVSFFYYFYIYMYVCKVYLCALTHYSSIIIISSRRWYDQTHSIARITTDQIRSFFYCFFQKSVEFLSSSLLNRNIYGLAPNGLLVRLIKIRKNS